MVKSIITVIFLCSFFACKEAGKKVAEELPMVKNDTFDFFGDEYDIPIPKEFSVDTIRHFDKETGNTEMLICPKIVGTEFDKIDEILKKEIKRKASLIYTDSTNYNTIDTSKEVFEAKYDNIPLKMYKNKKLVSYGFLSESSDPGAMRPFRKYFSINYDIIKKKFIYLNDYFKITSSSDSILLKSIIYGNVGNPDTRWYSFNNQINFSVDERNVYFYFDMFGETQTPMGLVKEIKKKYLDKFIKDEYK
jgi:hypothetical protein